jgi:diguanylate cyclase (GGDEF)-like protein
VPWFCETRDGFFRIFVVKRELVGGFHMDDRIAAADRVLTDLTPMQVFAIAFCGVVLVGLLDYATGYETSLSLIYLGPVAVAGWYSGRRETVAIAVLASITWLVADMASGHFYSHPLITLWELLVRLGVFLIQGLLLVALRDALAREHRLARTDVLTGLASRRAFEEQFEHDLRLAQRRHSAITLAFLDLDDFKIMNDTYGHLEGDQVLRVTGRVLKESMRVVDTAARYGGDEFVVVFPDTDGNGAEEAIAKIRQGLQQCLASVAPKITFSIGAITFLDPPPSVNEALKAADTLMYDAKRRGKGIALFRVIGKRAGKPFALVSAGRDRSSS